MKKLAAFVSTILSIFGITAAAAPLPVERQASQSTMAMRALLLASHSKDFGIQPASQQQIWAMVMDEGLEGGGSFSVVALSDGNASIYLSTGGGIIGGFAHPTVVNAVTSFVAISNALRSNFTATTSYPLPTSGQVCFYGISDSGVSTYSASTSALEKNNHSMHQLFHTGHLVITALRQTAESKR
jgi:hypothetical protein